MMQAANNIYWVSPPLSIVKPTTIGKSCLGFKPISIRSRVRAHRMRATLMGDSDPSTTDYSSNISVFPAEACETLGGEACDGEMYPEAKLDPKPPPSTTPSEELVDREYVDYNTPKTVFVEEACDDLGGEFCSPEFQSGTNY